MCEKPVKYWKILLTSGALLFSTSVMAASIIYIPATPTYAGPGGTSVRANGAWYCKNANLPGLAGNPEIGEKFGQPLYGTDCFYESSDGVKVITLQDIPAPLGGIIQVSWLCPLGWGFVYPTTVAGAYKCARWDTYPDTEKENGTPQCQAGNPVNIANGNKYQIEEDYIGAGNNPLKLVRYYNSNRASRQWDLSGWRFSYSRSIALRTAENISVATLIRDDGQLLRFFENSGQWTSDSDVVGQLQQTVNPAGWQFTNNRDETETYDASGKLISVATSSGLSHTLTYNSDGLLNTVQDSFGRQLIFEYQDGIIGLYPDNTPVIDVFKKSRIKRVRLPDNSLVN